MLTVIPTITNISNDAQLYSVSISGQVLDTHGCFTLCHSYQLKSVPNDLYFAFSLQDYGIVTGFKTKVDDKIVEAKVMTKSSVPQDAQEMVAKYFNEVSMTDSFVCRVAVAPDTTLEIYISFIEYFHLEGPNKLGFVIPTILAQKHYLLEEQNLKLSHFEHSLSQYRLELNLELLMKMKVSSVSSCTHPITFSRYADKIMVSFNESTNSIGEMDILVLIELEMPIDQWLPRCYLEHQKDETIIMASVMPQYNPSFVFDENNEEGHPDPREVLFLIDPHNTRLEEIKMVLSQALTLLDEQIYFNFIVLGKELKEENKIFHKSLCATKAVIMKANSKMNDQAFGDIFFSSPIHKRHLRRYYETYLCIGCGIRRNSAHNIPHITRSNIPLQ
jgi:hypothetical protein